MFITIDNLYVKAASASENIDQELAPYICRQCKISESQLLSYEIIRRSVDARKRNDVRLLYRITAELDDSTTPSLGEDVRESSGKQLEWTPPQDNSLKGRTVGIVGAGPAGLFAALTVALRGGTPVVLERGQNVDIRRQDIASFLSTRQLNPESNYLFGEGGAGTWSDGKLYTRLNDQRISFVLNEFIRCGAPRQIGYFSHPHIGSDLLPNVIANLRKKIIGFGGEFRWGCQVADIWENSRGCAGVQLSNGEKLAFDTVIIASGHSAREFILNMTSKPSITWECKGFQLGMRIEHPQAFINRLQYGKSDSFRALGAAEYNMSCKPRENVPGATSFCMCPGGEIIPATSDVNQFCSNGMSNAKRDGKFANSAIIATVSPEQFCHQPRLAYQLLSTIESKAFQLADAPYAAPAQNASDFLHGVKSRALRDSSYKLGLTPARLDSILPENIGNALKNAVTTFERLHHGFEEYGTFIGVETRVSSPVRFLRMPNSQQSSLQNLYFAGEGAGMAGGITSAAVDGIKIAENI